MGSGHFLVFALPILASMRAVEEGLNESDAVVAVLRDNLFGLELDARCTQLGAFNLAFAAWKKVGYCALPALHLACCGMSPNASKEEWVDLAGTNQKVQRGMARLHELFREGPTLGSLINPRALDDDLFGADFRELRPLLVKVLRSEAHRSDDHAERGVVAEGLAKATEILLREFILVVTNVPYLGRGKQDDVLKDYCERAHPDAKADLATCFVERCLDFCTDGIGTIALVTPQNWLFLGSYGRLRKRLLGQVSWDCLARLGPKGFQTPMWDFNVCLLTITATRATSAQHLAGLDVASLPTPSAKAEALRAAEPALVSQAAQLGNPDCRILLRKNNRGTLFAEHVGSFIGFQNGDSPRFLASFWELPTKSEMWEWLQATTNDTLEFSGLDSLLRWEGGHGAVSEIGLVKGREAWGKAGVCVRLVGELPCSLYFGHFYDQSSAVLIPKKSDDLTAVWTFCSSPEFRRLVREVDQALKVTNATLGKIPFDLVRWKRVAAEKYPRGLPTPYSGDPTQWLFTGQPRGSDRPLHVAVARMVGYRWPRQTGSSFPNCPAVGKDGLEKNADDDGIVCLPSIRREEPAADRLETLLAAAFGKEWTTAKRDELLAQVEFSGKSLDDWLRNGFFAQHCALFHDRPFIWHIWDGVKRDGFHALVNYHKLDRKLLETLTYAYLGDWIKAREHDEKHKVAGAGERVAAAKALQGALESILEGEAPFDIFVRWKPLHQQPIGWEPDLNDGVRLNIRPFLSVDDVGTTGAGILRSRPKSIHWKKDRGQNPDSAPWYPVDKGERVNDRHLSLDEKRRARSKKASGT